MSRQPKKYAIDDIRSRFQTVAIDNRYQVFMKPNMTIYNAAAEAGVTRRFVDEDLGLYASDAVLPGSSFADIEVVGDRQGITERMPFGRIYDDVTFTFMVDKDYQTLRFFEAWTQLVNPNSYTNDIKKETIGEIDKSISTGLTPPQYIMGNMQKKNTKEVPKSGCCKTKRKTIPVKKNKKKILL